MNRNGLVAGACVVAVVVAGVAEAAAGCVVVVVVAESVPGFDTAVAEF